jgi:hypothetical protein
MPELPELPEPPPGVKRGTHVLVRAGRGGVRIEAESVAALRECAGSSWAVRETRQLTVLVESWRPPRPGWSGELGPVPGLVRHEFDLPRGGSGRVVVRLQLTQPAPLHLLLAAVLGVLRPWRRTPAPVSVDVACYGPHPAWLPLAQNTAGFVGRDPDEEKVRPYDVLLVDDHPDRRSTEPGPAGAVAARVDETSIAIMGRHTILADADADADADASSVVRAGFGLPEPGRRTGGLTGDDPAAEAAELVRRALTGAPLYLPKLPEQTAALLASELVAIMAEERADSDDSLACEVRGVRQRRAALRHHASGTAFASALGVLSPRPPGVTALLAPVREERIPVTLAALASQTYPELEIVLALTGGQRTEAVNAAIAACGRPVTVLDTVRVEGISRLDDAAAHARGPLLARIDEAVIYGPEHVWDLVLAREVSGATLVGKSAEFTHHAGVTARRRLLLIEAYASRVSPGSMLISLGDLESLGGWSQLTTRVRDSGALTYRTHPLGYVRLSRTPVPRDATPRWTGLPPYPEFGGLHNH